MKPNTQEYQGSANKEISCKKCPSTFISVRNLNHHNLTIHNQLGNKQTSSVETSVFEECDKCRKVFKDLNQLRAHVVNNHGQKFKCAKCEFEGTSKEKLESHDVLYHVGISTHQNISIRISCELCEFSCTTKNDMNKHQKIST